MERESPPPPKKLAIAALARLLASIPVFGALLFLPAGTTAYWEAWLYLGTLYLPILAVSVYLLRNDPDLLRRRMDLEERQPEQRRIVAVFALYILLAYILPGFDHRFGWSSPPAWLVLAADALILLGYGWFALVLRENSYASRTIDVVPGQELVTSGPYAVVRHPMYLGVLVLFGFTPLALGSCWGMAAMSLLPLLLAWRIRNEERVLREHLEGYREYARRVKYRLIPGIW